MRIGCPNCNKTLNIDVSIKMQCNGCSGLFYRMHLTPIHWKLFGHWMKKVDYICEKCRDTEKGRWKHAKVEE